MNKKRNYQILIYDIHSLLFFYQPVFHVLAFAFALEVELNIIKGIAYLLERCLWVEVWITIGQKLADVAKTPPFSLFTLLWSAKTLAYHLNQIIQLLERLVLFNQRLDFIIIQPESLTVIK